jgi:hypothetical protein
MVCNCLGRLLPAELYRKRRAQVAHELDFFIDFHAYLQQNPNVFGSESAVFAM